MLLYIYIAPTFKSEAAGSFFNLITHVHMYIVPEMGVQLIPY